MYIQFNDRTVANLEQLKTITGMGVVHLLNIAVQELLINQLKKGEKEFAHKEGLTYLQ
jgi:hypothetical protein